MSKPTPEQEQSSEPAASYVDKHAFNPGGCLFEHPHPRLTVVSQPTSGQEGSNE